MDDAAFEACNAFAGRILDVATKQDRSDLARAVNYHARQSSEPQFVQGGAWLTDTVGSWTGFMWNGMTANFWDLCVKGGYEERLSQPGSAAGADQGDPAGGGPGGVYSEPEDVVVDEGAPEGPPPSEPVEPEELEPDVGEPVEPTEEAAEPTPGPEPIREPELEPQEPDQSSETDAQMPTQDSSPVP